MSTLPPSAAHSTLMLDDIWGATQIKLSSEPSFVRYMLRMPKVKTDYLCKKLPKNNVFETVMKNKFGSL